MGRSNQKVSLSIESNHKEKSKIWTKRVAQLAKTPDTPSRSYQAMVKRFEKLAEEFGWQNKNGSIYPVAEKNLAKYIAFHEKRVKPQSITSYLSALREKYEQMG